MSSSNWDEFGMHEIFPSGRSNDFIRDSPPAANAVWRCALCDAEEPRFAPHNNKGKTHPELLRAGWREYRLALLCPDHGDCQ